MKTRVHRLIWSYSILFLILGISFNSNAQLLSKSSKALDKREVVVPTELNPSDLISDYENQKATGKQPLGKTQEKVTLFTGLEFSGYNPNNSNTSQRSGGCFIPVDASFTAVPRNDDGSYGPISLGFNFNLYGTNYSQVYINTNGNLTFTGAVYSYSSTGFPFGTPMVAPFWGDVDTRNGGQIYFKLSATNLIVTWNGVRYYPSSSAALNTFQAIIGTNSDALTGVGQNVSLRYADMQWTTGDASSGSGGFGGIPGTVGINKGNGVNYVQIGRFNQNNTSYDGPGGSFDGVHYLDNQCVSFNASNASNIAPSITGLPANNNLNMSCGQTANLTLTAIAPEVNQNVTVVVNTGGMCNTTSSVSGGTINLSIGASPCNAGVNTITITVTDNGTPVRTTVQTITVTVANCCQLAISGIGNDATCVDATDGSVNLSQTGGSGTVSYYWSNGQITQDLLGVAPGTYSVTATDANGCTDNTSVTIGFSDVILPTALAQNVTVQLDASGNGTTTAALVDNGSTDACGIATMTIDNASFTCANVGSNNAVTLTVTDVNGNVSAASAMVTVEDNVNPLAVAQGVTVQLDALGNGSTAAALVDNGSSDACGIASLSLDNTSFTCANVGPNSVTLTVVDNNGNASTSMATVMVEDNEAPVAMCQAVTVTLANGTASVTPSMVDNGSNDACGIASLTLSEDTWTCGDIGDHLVTLTVTDNNGNVSSCDAVVTVSGVIPSCSIASLPSNNTYTGGVSTTLYLGYGSQSTTLSCAATGGNSFTYAWTGLGLSSSTAANPVFTPTSEGIYNFSVLVTNDNGCETTCAITICVRDIQVYKKGKVQKNKVYLCHLPPGNNSNSQTLSISVNAVASHLTNHAGDALGTCGASCGDLSVASKTGEMFSEDFEGQDVDIILYPNPSTDHFSVMVESDMEELITVELYDMAGNLIEQVTGQFTYHEIEMGRNLASGMYMVVVTQGNYRKVLKASRTN